MLALTRIEPPLKNTSTGVGGSFADSRTAVVVTETKSTWLKRSGST
jgi:hypothetical protein